MSNLPRRIPGSFRRITAPFHRSRDQRGAALIESAIVLPVVFVVIFGTLELGLYFKTFLTAGTMSRDGARVASAEGNNFNADQAILRRVLKSGTGLDSGQLTKVSIYRPTAMGTIPACPSSDCNVYLPVHLAQVDDDTKFGCGAGAFDTNFCPTFRDVTNDTDMDAVGDDDPTDKIGVSVEVHHEFVVKFFAGSVDRTENSVLYIEPARYE